MQEHHHGALQAEHDSENVAAKRSADLEESITKAINQRLAHGPRPLNLLDVRSDFLSSRIRELLQSLSYGFIARRGPVEATRKYWLLPAGH